MLPRRKLTSELRRTFVVEDDCSLDRYVDLLTESTVSRSEYVNATNAIHSNIQALLGRMEHDAARADDRFRAQQESIKAGLEAQADARFRDFCAEMRAQIEATDRRLEEMRQASGKPFDDSDRRFTMWVAFLTVAVGALGIIPAVIKLFGL